MRVQVKKSSRIRKSNPYVKSLLVEVANSAIKTNSQFKDKYETLVIRRGHKRAIAHKMIEVIYSLLKVKKAYKDPCNRL